MAKKIALSLKFFAKYKKRPNKKLIKSKSKAMQRKKSVHGFFDDQIFEGHYPHLQFFYQEPEKFIRLGFHVFVNGAGVKEAVLNLIVKA